MLHIQAKRRIADNNKFVLIFQKPSVFKFKDLENFRNDSISSCLNDFLGNRFATILSEYSKKNFSVSLILRKRVQRIIESIVSLF